MGVILAPPPAHLAMSRDILGCYDWGLGEEGAPGISWVEARNAKHPIMPRTALQQRFIESKMSTELKLKNPNFLSFLYYSYLIVLSRRTRTLSIINDDHFWEDGVDILFPISPADYN